jgi:SAM-dependent methyltransferase
MSGSRSALDDAGSAAAQATHPEEGRRGAAGFGGRLDALGLRPGGKALDAGCGRGEHLALLVQRVAPGGVVVGLDSDGEVLETARVNHRGLVEGGALRLCQGDILDPPLQRRSFDAVWSSAVLHHIEDQAGALRAMAGLARPGGVVAVLEGDGEGSFPLLPWPPALELRLRVAAHRAEADSYGGRLPYHMDRYVGRRLTRLLREAGLGSVEIRPVPEVDRAPLTPERESELRSWFLHSFGDRVRPYLAPHDWEEVEARLDPGSDACLLSTPDFFCVRTYYLATGTAGGDADVAEAERGSAGL